MELRAVPRVHASLFRAPSLPGEPRVVFGEADHWPATTSWSPQYLQKIAGDKEVSVREKKGTARNIYQNLQSSGTVPFSDYLGWVMEVASNPAIRDLAETAQNVAELTRAMNRNTSEPFYYLDVKLEALSAALLDDVRIPKWYVTPPVDIIFWCGVLGTSSGLHSDVKPNCNVQLLGRKHFILFHPDQSGNVYRIPGITHCRFDPNLPDFEQFPLANAATGLECTLNPGEALYIPVGWYHQVTVVSDWAINVNFFWPRPLVQSIATPVLWSFLAKRLWARWRAKFNNKIISQG